MLRQIMSRWHLLAVPIVAGGMLWATAAGGFGASEVRKQIGQAVRAPYEAVAHRDAAALCADFTPPVAAGLVADAPTGSTCEQAVAHVFALTAPYEPSPPASLPEDWAVTHVAWHGDHATALLVYGKQGSTSFALQKIAGRWLIATRARVVAVAGCRGKVGASNCPSGGRVLLVLLGSPTVSRGPAPIPPPATVKRAGGKELNEFEQGSRVFVQTGCEACHRIGNQGNPGPGPALTHIGSTLTTRQIEHALVDPRAPMPSFSHLPAGKFKSLIEFLSLLR
jgi:hypothetical protein